MAKPLLDDELWALIEPLIPRHKPRRFRYPGRKPLDHRKVLTGILFVLRTGIQWEYLPRELGCGSGMTCWNHLHEWQEAGVWQKIHELLLAKLQGADKLDWSRAIVDSSSVRAIFGGPRQGQTPRTAARQARSTMWPRMPKASRLQRS
jgi:transposase